MDCDGYRIPEGTIVSLQPWTLHQDSKVFKLPGFPAREMVRATEVELRAMNRSFMAFWAGICIGVHFAVQEMKLIIANI